MLRGFSKIEPYLSKGFSFVKKDFAFGSLVEMVLDEGGVEDPDARVDIMGHIYMTK